MSSSLRAVVFETVICNSAISTKVKERRYFIFKIGDSLTQFGPGHGQPELAGDGHGAGELLQLLQLPPVFPLPSLADVGLVSLLKP